MQGMLGPEELKDRVGRGEIDTVVVGFTDLYGRLMGKRFDAGFFLESGVGDGTHACDYLLTADVELEPVQGYAFANWQKGYGDVHLVPDMRTLRVASWLDRTALVLCDVRTVEGDEPVEVSPRAILRRQLERSSAAGFDVEAAAELEYYLFRDSYERAAARNWHGLEPAGWYLEDYVVQQGTRGERFHGEARRHLARSGVPVECSKGEWGLGQHELNVRHAPALEMADRHAVFKQCLRELADSLGVSVTFMAKFSESRAGSSCHVHLSLWRDGRNAFEGDEPLGRVRCAPEMRWFLAGWMAHAPEVACLYAPNVNSYKRYQSASWAPTRLLWAHDNRTVGFRTVGHGAGVRIECRLPGADCNAYLAFAAAIASGLAGMRERLEPPPMFEGDAYQARDAPTIPRNLEAATDLFERSAFARDAFGDAVVDHLVHFFRTEQAAADRAVTDWERRRYFERI